MDTGYLRFTEQLIKGRIAETIFEMMFKDVEGFQVSHFGIEHTSPELLGKEIWRKNFDLREKLGKCPDFVVIDKANIVTLVEVKYCSSLTTEKVNKFIAKIAHYWGEASLFLITPDNFHYDSIKNIINNHGEIALLSSDLIPLPTQQEYLTILKKFI